MYLNRELFKKIVLCGINRSKIRGLTITAAGWRINKTANNFWRYDNSGLIYPLGIILENYYSYGRSENETVARRLGVAPSIIQAFNEGFCTYHNSLDALADHKYYNIYGDEYFAMAFGFECKRFLEK